MGNMTESYDENKAKGRVVQEHCEQCGRSTRHMVMGSYDYSGREDYDGGSF